MTQQPHQGTLGAQFPLQPGQCCCRYAQRAQSPPLRVQGDSTLQVTPMKPLIHDSLLPFPLSHRRMKYPHHLPVGFHKNPSPLQRPLLPHLPIYCYKTSTCITEPLEELLSPKMQWNPKHSHLDLIDTILNLEIAYIRPPPIQLQSFPLKPTISQKPNTFYFKVIIKLEKK